MQRGLTGKLDCLDDFRVIVPDGGAHLSRCEIKDFTPSVIIDNTAAGSGEQLLKPVPTIPHQEPVGGFSQFSSHLVALLSTLGLKLAANPDYSLAFTR